MKGTLVNAAAVIVGGFLGLLLKKGIKESFQISMNKALGVSVLIIGIKCSAGAHKARGHMTASARKMRRRKD